jgi:ribosomal protein L3 glutamine methyltransferase
MTAGRPRTSAARAKAGRKAARLATLGDWLGHAESLYVKSGAALGQTAADPHDEALYLLLRTLGLPLDSDAGVLGRILTAAERARVARALDRRLSDRIPAAYLTGEAHLGGCTFRVDERAIIPRSYFVEVIPRLRGKPARIADIGTGSGCLAILLAHRFPGARVDAVELSPRALAVAAINVRIHRLRGRVRLLRSDVFDAVPMARYDVIVSNPPYEPSALVDGLPAEFKREPRMALDGGADGLAVIRKLIRQAAGRLKPRGRLLIEVGGLRRAIDREFAALKPRWLRTADGTDCVCRIEAAAYRSRS